MRFSERYGHRPVRDALQFESMDDALRNRLWNVLDRFLRQGIPDVVHSEDGLPEVVGENYTEALLTRVWDRLLKRSLSSLPRDVADAMIRVRDYFFECEWFQVYDLLEFVAGDPTLAGYRDQPDEFIGNCNRVMQQECSGYRFVGKVIAPITSAAEITTIEEALEAARPLRGVQAHLDAALAKLSQRPDADYRNSIKESISAVESLARLITGNEKATLGKALDKIESASGIKTHAALRGAMDKLYGYTSDEQGIRHAMLDEPNVALAEAKFMLGACASFVSYLLAKCADAKINLGAE